MGLAGLWPHARPGCAVPASLKPECTVTSGTGRRRRGAWAASERMPVRGELGDAVGEEKGRGEPGRVGPVGREEAVRGARREMRAGMREMRPVRCKKDADGVNSVKFQSTVETSL